MKLVHILAAVSTLAIAGPAFAQVTGPAPIGGGAPSSLTFGAPTNSAPNGSASTTSSATFNLTAAVAQDCSFFTGGGDVTVDFGTLGIFNTSAQGIDNAFEMTGPASRTVTTSVAGCNTPNTVTVSKNDVRGLINAGATAFDTNTFQSNLPYTVNATYTAAGNGVIGVGTTQTITIPATGSGGSQTHGAWKSAMTLTFGIPVANLALVAGNYTGSTTVTLAALSAPAS